jgi:hypothetical protein
MSLGSDQAAWGNLALCQTGVFRDLARGIGAPPLPPRTARAARQSGLSTLRSAVRTPAVGLFLPNLGSNPHEANGYKNEAASYTGSAIGSCFQRKGDNKQGDKVGRLLSSNSIATWDFDTVRKELMPAAPSVIGQRN